METAAEKWVAITRRIASISRGYDCRDETLIRHLYDLEAITRSFKLTDNFFYLVFDTIERDKSKFKRHAKYYNDPIKETNFAIKILKNDKILQQNFENFLEVMVFRKENISFKKCYENLQKISEKIFNYIKLQPKLKKNNELIQSPAISKKLIISLKLYLEFQVNLQKVCDEKSNARDSEQSDKLLHKAKIISGRIKKLTKDTLKIPQASNFLSSTTVVINPH